MNLEIIHIYSCYIHSLLYHFKDCLLTPSYSPKSACNLCRSNFDICIFGFTHSTRLQRIDDFRALVQMMSSLNFSTISPFRCLLITLYSVVSPCKHRCRHIYDASLGLWFLGIFLSKPFNLFKSLIIHIIITAICVLTSTSFIETMSKAFSTRSVVHMLQFCLDVHILL